MNVEILTEDQAIKDVGFPVEVKVYASGVQLKPASATIVVKDPDGDEALASVAMTVNSTTGTMTYTVSAALMDTLWENGVLEVSYIMGTGGTAVTYRAVFFFDVVLQRLTINVIDNDLKAYFPLLADDLWSGTANYAGQIEEAFKLVKRMIKDKGRRPAMLIDGSQVRELVIIKTFEMIFFNFAKSETDIWWLRYEKYKNLFTERFETLLIKYDENESGTIDTDEAGTFSQPTLVR